MTIDLKCYLDDLSGFKSDPTLTIAGLAEACRLTVILQRELAGSSFADTIPNMVGDGVMEWIETGDSTLGLWKPLRNVAFSNGGRQRVADAIEACGAVPQTFELPRGVEKGKAVKPLCTEDDKVRIIIEKTAPDVRRMVQDSPYYGMILGWHMGQFPVFGANSKSIILAYLKGVS